MKKVLAMILALTMFCSLAACGSEKNSDDSAAGSDKVHATIIVVPEDGTEDTHEIEVTPDSNLRDALLEAELVTEEEHGAMFIKTIAGHTADWESEETPRTWEVQNEKREQIQGFFEEIQIEDGATYYIVDIEVPFFDD